MAGQNKDGFKGSMCASGGHTRRDEVVKIAVRYPLSEPRDVASKQHGIQTDPAVMTNARKKRRAYYQ